MRLLTDGPSVVGGAHLAFVTGLYVIWLVLLSFSFMVLNNNNKNLTKYSVLLWIGHLSNLFQLGIASTELQMLEYNPKSASRSSKSSRYTTKKAGSCVDSGPVYFTCKTRAGRWQLQSASFYPYPLSNVMMPGNQMITSVTNTNKEEIRSEWGPPMCSQE